MGHRVLSVRRQSLYYIEFEIDVRLSPHVKFCPQEKYHDGLNIAFSFFVRKKGTVMERTQP